MDAECAEHAVLATQLISLPSHVFDFFNKYLAHSIHLRNLPRGDSIIVSDDYVRQRFRGFVYNLAGTVEIIRHPFCNELLTLGPIFLCELDCWRISSAARLLNELYNALFEIGKQVREFWEASNPQITFWKPLAIPYRLEKAMRDAMKYANSIVINPDDCMIGGAILQKKCDKIWKLCCKLSERDIDNEYARYIDALMCISKYEILLPPDVYKLVIDKDNLPINLSDLHRGYNPADFIVVPCICERSCTLPSSE